MELKPWVKIPSGWIEQGRLSKLQWKAGGDGSDRTAALMSLVALAHATDQETGLARVTYDSMCGVTGLSRSKLSNGLEVLERMHIIERAPKGRSTYQLAKYNAQFGWAKLPFKSMYSGGRIAAFGEFRLRRPSELDALKLFFLFIARRDRKMNVANISYDKISEYSGVSRTKIKSAISLLAALSLVYTEQVPSSKNEYGMANAYRIVGVDSSIHMGTRGRSFDHYDFEQE